MAVPRDSIMSKEMSLQVGVEQLVVGGERCQGKGISGKHDKPMRSCTFL